MSHCYHWGMTDDVNAVNWRFSLRGTLTDKAIVQRVVDAHARMGLRISLNDAVLVLIRRGATPDPNSRAEAAKQIEQHWEQCEHGCNRDEAKCPEGWRLRDAWGRLDFFVTLAYNARQEAAAAPAPADPAPQGWRRALTLTGKRAG
jgi:hypothetical protein